MLKHGAMMPRTTLGPTGGARQASVAHSLAMTQIELTAIGGDWP